MRILVLYSLASDAIASDRNRDEFDLSEAAAAVAEALPEAAVCGTQGNAREIIGLLDCHAPDVVFNACEAPLGRPDLEAHVAALLEWTGVRFTGCGSETLALCRRKDRVNAVLDAAGVAVPRSGMFPCIVKPADQDGSFGIDADSVCADEAAASAARARLDGRALTEEYLPGREFAVAMWGGAHAEQISIAEYRFLSDLRLNTYRSKWAIDSDDYRNTPLDYHAPMDELLREAVRALAANAWRAVEARGYLRVDIRLDAEGQPRVLDVNPNSSICPGTGIHRAAAEAGWTWERFVRQQIGWART